MPPVVLSVEPGETLHYARVSAPRSGADPLNLILLLLTLPAAAAPVVRFCYGISPAWVILEFIRLIHQRNFDSSLWLGLLAVPFLTGSVTVAWQIRLLASTYVPALEHLVLRSLAVTSAIMSLGFVTSGYALNNLGWRLDEVLISATGLGITTAGAGVVVWLLNTRASGVSITLTMLLTAYLTNSGMVLQGFTDTSAPGWWMVLVSSAGMLAQIALIVTRNFRTKRA